MITKTFVTLLASVCLVSVALADENYWRASAKAWADTIAESGEPLSITYVSKKGFCDQKVLMIPENFPPSELIVRINYYDETKVIGGAKDPIIPLSYVFLSDELIEKIKRGKYIEIIYNDKVITASLKGSFVALEKAEYDCQLEHSI